MEPFKVMARVLYRIRQNVRKYSREKSILWLPFLGTCELCEHGFLFMVSRRLHCLPTDHGVVNGLPSCGHEGI